MPTLTTPLLSSDAQPDAQGTLEAGYGSIPSTNGASLPTVSPESTLGSPSLTLPPSFLREPSIEALRQHFSLPAGSSTPEQTALILVALLNALHGLHLASPTSSEPTHEVLHSRTDAQSARLKLGELVLGVFNGCVDESAELERVLWTGVDSGAGRFVRMVDYLVLPSCPLHLAAHPIVRVLRERTWSLGLQPFFSPEPPAGVARAWYWLDGFSTPRLLHAHALLLRLTFLVLALHVVLFPPLDIFPTESGGPELRTHWTPVTIVWAIFTLSTPLSTPFLPPVLAMLSLLISLPTPPVPHSFPFGLLLISIALELFLLHLPRPPSPIFLSSAALRLSIAFRRLFGHAVLPVLAFFLPVALLGIVAISLSLKGEAWHPYAVYASPSYSLPEPGHVSPYETRVMLLIVLIATLVGYIWLVGVRSMSSPTAAAVEVDESEIARTLVLAQRAYAYLPSSSTSAVPSTYRLPPPLNVLELLLADLPFALLSLSRMERLQQSGLKWRDGVRRWIWRAGVGWVVALLGCVAWAVEKAGVAMGTWVSD